MWRDSINLLRPQTFQSNVWMHVVKGKLTFSFCASSQISYIQWGITTLSRDESEIWWWISFTLNVSAGKKKAAGDFTSGMQAAKASVFHKKLNPTDLSDFQWRHCVVFVDWLSWNLVPNTLNGRTFDDRLTFCHHRLTLLQFGTKCPQDWSRKHQSLTFLHYKNMLK